MSLATAPAPQMRTIRVVCATKKKTRAEFDSDTMLGRSLAALPSELLPELNVKLDNGGTDRIGLPKLYNTFLRQEYRDEIVLFVHDDVWIDDWWLVRRLREAAEYFDVIGLAGNAKPDFAEPAWLLGWNKNLYPTGFQPAENVSGAVAHLSHDQQGMAISFYGSAPRRCRLLDGLFIAVNVSAAFAKDVRFDERFEFHFYDLDFCRTAEVKGLRLGTWPIAVTHASGGSFGSAAWIEAMKLYSDKWPVPAGDVMGAPEAPSRVPENWLSRLIKWRRSRSGTRTG